MKDTFPFYFEVKLYDEESNFREEGGFTLAEDWKGAMTYLEEYYSHDLITVKLEQLDICDLMLPLEKSRKMKEIVDANR
jgi:hypothetical protein